MWSQMWGGGRMRWRGDLERWRSIWRRRLRLFDGREGRDGEKIRMRMWKN